MLAGFLGEAVAEAGLAHATLAGAVAAGDAGEVRRVAHRLRGTAGSLGLARLAAVAAAIEDGMIAGADVAAEVARLGEAVAATREAFGASAVPLPPAT